ncbi:hypothetical protein GGX14DRAFT_382864 [Mycena pura]|uniref:Uncharacterized protein n=1 Tax=Mycena pura TaxID=153505 RepID=A0AAD6Y3A6_9AGAR|nr:hypothetical protein GGX14DRAFT_382864 [Mycena pura]
MLAIEKHLGKDCRTSFASVFAMMALNMGPRSCASSHRDGTDLLHLCSVTGLGDYCSKKGAHLALFEAGLLVELPAGWTILFPSALITHANALIQDGETRTSIVQYTPAALARYVHNGFKHPSQLKKSNLKAWKAAMADKATRWEQFKKSFPTVDQVKGISA